MCKLCGDRPQYHMTGSDMSVRIYIEGTALIISCVVGYGRSAPITLRVPLHMNYCPECGRKLKKL